MTGELHPFPMVTMLDDSLLETIDNLRKFVDGVLPITFRPLRRDERAHWIRSTLVRFKYLTLRRIDKKVVRAYLLKVANLSRAQLTRHIEAYRENVSICRAYRRRRFPVTYTAGDIELLASTDNLHGRLNGAATIAIMAEEYRRGDRRYERLKDISVSRLYDLRQAARYTAHSITFEKTKPVQRAIGERRKPEPRGMPGFLRVDTVHQGDHGKDKGVYHLNFVDEVTQWEVVVAVEQLTEACVEPALVAAFALVPFRIENFHSDNGSEFINDIVRQFLCRWQSTQTKSRPRHSNDNGLVETKNGAVIRKHMTYHHIPRSFAARINRFYQDHLISYLNFHRPCAFPVIEMLPNGKKHIRYPQKYYLTPYQKLTSLPNWEAYLRPGITVAMLQTQANTRTPNQAAREMQEAKKKLFDIILPRYRDIL
jgi:transposase InsO family protein